MKNTGLPFYSAIVFLICFVIAGCEKENSPPTSPETKSFRVSGKVQDKNGAGISGVSVKISGNAYAATDISDTLGGFLFNSVTSGTYTVITEAEERVFKPSGIDISVADSEIDTLKFTIAENRIHGKVMDIITNKGIPDIPVAIQQNSTNHTWGVTSTDSKGRYEFYDVPADDYSFHLYIDPRKQGDRSQTFYYFYHDAFTDRELSGPEFYMSSEILEFTTATFSKETNTVHLEWANSKSNFCNGYVLMRYGKLPLGTGNGYGDGYDTNSVFIEITPKYRGVINNAKTIYFAVYASYHINIEGYNRVTGPYSEYVSIQVAE